MNSTRITISALALASALSAQNYAIAPIDNTDPGATSYPRHVEGSTSTNAYPFSRGISRVMYLYETQEAGRTLLDLPAGAQITSLTFPSDAGRVSSGESLQMTVRMGHTTKTTATMENNFEANYTGAAETVFPTAIFALPSLNDPLAGLVPSVEIPLPVPFVYNGTDNLIVEFQISANSNGNQQFSYHLDRAMAISTVTSSGQGCQTSAGGTPELTSTPTAIGDTWRTQLRYAPANSLCAMLVGFAALPMPVAIPDASGCILDVLVATAIPGNTNAGGATTWNVPIGDSIDNWHVEIVSQAACVDLFANTLGVVTSNTDAVDLGIDPRVAMLQASGNANAPAGSLSRSWGQVIYFGWQ